MQAAAANVELENKVKTDHDAHLEICDYLRGEIHSKNLLVNDVQVCLTAVGRRHSLRCRSVTRRLMDPCCVMISRRSGEE